jgi:hypothetical protein
VICSSTNTSARKHSRGKFVWDCSRFETKLTDPVVLGIQKVSSSFAERVGTSPRTIGLNSHTTLATKVLLTFARLLSELHSCIITEKANGCQKIGTRQ